MGGVTSQKPTTLVWFMGQGWWFQAFNQRFGPYPEISEARYHLRVLQGLSRQLSEVVTRQQA